MGVALFFEGNAQLLQRHLFSVSDLGLGDAKDGSHFILCADGSVG